MMLWEKGLAIGLANTVGGVIPPYDVLAFASSGAVHIRYPILSDPLGPPLHYKSPLDELMLDSGRAYTSYQAQPVPLPPIAIRQTNQTSQPSLGTNALSCQICSRSSRALLLRPSKGQTEISLSHCQTDEDVPSSGPSDAAETTGVKCISRNLVCSKQTRVQQAEGLNYLR